MEPGVRGGGPSAAAAAVVVAGGLGIERPRGQGRRPPHVTAVTSEQDARLVLLHELAHWLRRGTHAHDRRFWEIAWDLFGRYGVDMDWTIFREGTYLKRSLYAAYQRVSGRILETWHAGDTLAPFLYRGR